MGEETGRIIKVYGLYYTVESEGKRINCVLRGKMRKDNASRRYSVPAVVGDEVLFECNQDGNGVINEIKKRNCVFSRKGKGKNKKEDIIASNVDQIVVIQSFKNPRLNLRFVDRLSVRAAKDGIPLLLCINKLDLAERGMVEYVRDYYGKAPIGISMLCATQGKGLRDFEILLRDKTSVLAGYSGVGKTSILNALYPGIQLPVDEVSASTGKGRHTTTNVQMVIVSDTTAIIDTPGLREFGLVDIEPHLAGNYFYEFSKYAPECGYNPCTHDHEPECRVKAMVENGTISEDRYVSYLNILFSIKDIHARKYE